MRKEWDKRSKLLFSKEWDGVLGRLCFSRVTYKRRIFYCRTKDYIFVSIWLGNFHLQYNSPGMNKILSSRMRWPLSHKTYRFDKDEENNERQIGLTYHWKNKSLFIECIEI